MENFCVGAEGAGVGQLRTVFTHGRLAVREMVLASAHGFLACTDKQLAARLAGGFATPVNRDALLSAGRDALVSTALGTLQEIKTLSGMPHAAADTIWKARRTSIDLQTRAVDHSRIASLSPLEGVVIERLPPRMLRPAELVRKALNRITFAQTILGRIEIHGLTELSPVWRPLLLKLAETLSVIGIELANFRHGSATPPWRSRERKHSRGEKLGTMISFLS
jgi:hypothetical protein